MARFLQVKLNNSLQCVATPVLLITSRFKRIIIQEETNEKEHTKDNLWKCNTGKGLL